MFKAKDKDDKADKKSAKGKAKGKPSKGSNPFKNALASAKK